MPVLHTWAVSLFWPGVKWVCKKYIIWETRQPLEMGEDIITNIKHKLLNILNIFNLTYLNHY